MRTFFAVDLPVKTKLDLGAWRNKSFPPMEGEIPAANFHITLCFNGKTTDAQLDKLQRAADDIKVKEFQVHLNNVGYFSKPQITFAGLEHTPPSLQTLHTQLTSFTNSMGLNIEKQRFCPHVSLFRGATTPPPAALFPPALSFEVKTFGLYESLSQKSGVIYRPIFEWDLERDYRPRALKP